MVSFCEAQKNFRQFTLIVNSSHTAVAIQKCMLKAAQANTFLPIYSNLTFTELNNFEIVNLSGLKSKCYNGLPLRKAASRAGKGHIHG